MSSDHVATASTPPELVNSTTSQKGDAREVLERGKAAMTKENIADRGTYTQGNGWYVDSVTRHDLLSKNEEIILGREIQILMKMEAAKETLEMSLKRYVRLFRSAPTSTGDVLMTSR